MQCTGRCAKKGRVPGNDHACSASVRMYANMWPQDKTPSKESSGNLGQISNILWFMLFNTQNMFKQIIDMRCIACVSSETPEGAKCSRGVWEQFPNPKHNVWEISVWRILFTMIQVHVSHAGLLPTNTLTLIITYLCLSLGRGFVFVSLKTHTLLQKWTPQAIYPSRRHI